MADVTIVIDGDPADVHADMAPFNRLKHFLPTGQGIKQLEHGGYVPNPERRLGQCDHMK